MTSSIDKPHDMSVTEGVPDAPARQRRATASDAPVAVAPAMQNVASATDGVAQSAPSPDRTPVSVGDQPAPAPAEGAAEPAQGLGGSARRGRNRRRGRNKERVRDAARADSAQEGERREAGPTPRTAPLDAQRAAQAGERFAQVVAGDFDASEDTEAAAGISGDEDDDGDGGEVHKRVLEPDADAPKLHKVLAQAGIGSRRDMEQLILEGRISVNGEPAHIGQRISWGDQVKVSGKPIKVRIAPSPARVIAYHKPAGEVVSYDDPQQRPTVFRRLPRLHQGKWQSVGRLDINTEGLLLFTTSGELANRLMHPRFGVEREYAVRVLGQLDATARARLIEGVDVDGQRAALRSIEDGGGEGANRWVRVVITEGRNREVRKLFEAVGLVVSRLIRIRYGHVVLPRGLRRGMWVDLDESDLRALRRLVGHEQRRDGPRDDAHEGKGPRPAQRGKRGRNAQAARPDEPAPPPRVPREHQPVSAVDRDDGDEFDDDIEHHGPIPNPLQQTFDRRFVQGGGKQGGFSGFGRPGGGDAGQGGPRKKGQQPGPRQPDPMQTSVGYIGADTLLRKGAGRGGNRGGGSSGGAGGQRGGFGGGGRRGGR